jgi:hypothetical protein
MVILRLADTQVDALIVVTMMMKSSCGVLPIGPER